MAFFLQLAYTCDKLATPFGHQRKSVRKFNLRLLASPFGQGFKLKKKDMKGTYLTEKVFEAIDFISIKHCENIDQLCFVLELETRPQNEILVPFSPSLRSRRCHYIWVIGQACSVKMAGYWPSSFFACLWTEGNSRSINTQKKNEDLLYH